MDFETIFSNCFFSLSHNLVERHTTLPKQKEKERVVLFFSLAALLCLLRDVVACVVARACCAQTLMLCLICARDDAFVLDAAKTKTDNTNPKLHPYMFRVFFLMILEKLPFFFFFV